MDTIEFLYNIIGTPLGYILYFIYNFICSNVGIAILLFTFIIKLVMLPFAIKQQKNTAKSAIFAPKVKEIQTKYKNNQQKQQEELSKLQQQGYNPMGGCGSMIATFLILFGVLDVVYKPMTHIVHVPTEKTASIIEESYQIGLASIFVDEVNNTVTLEGDALTKHEGIVRDAQKILDYYNANLVIEGETALDTAVWSDLAASKDMVIKVFQDAMKKEYAIDTKYASISDIDMYRINDDESKALALLENENDKIAYRAEHQFSEQTRAALSTLQTHFGGYKVSGDVGSQVTTFAATSSLQRELFALECFGTGNNKDVYKANVIGPELKTELTELYDNLNFLGIPLGQVPWDHMGWPMILIPILAFIFSLAQTFISNKMMEKNNPAGGLGNGMKMTMYIMPLFSLVLVFTVPAGAGFYWTISYVFGIAQTIVLNKLYSPEKLRAQAEAEYAERMKKVSVQATQVRDTDSDNAVVEVNGEKLSQKEINRRRLAEARRQDALKYGEEYTEDDDKKD